MSLKSPLDEEHSVCDSTTGSFTKPSVFSSNKSAIGLYKRHSVFTAAGWLQKVDTDDVLPINAGDEAGVI